MNYMKITKFDTANGPGIRTVLWVAGCSHQCRGCHNPETWNPNAGKLYTDAVLDEIIDSLRPNYIAGLTISGGDPLYVTNIQQVSNIVCKIRETYPDKSIWLYTGYTWEDIILEVDMEDNYELFNILENIDVLVDGEYVESKRDLRLIHCGSSNQRVIDVQATIKANHPYDPILYEGDNYGV